MSFCIFGTFNYSAKNTGLMSSSTGTASNFLVDDFNYETDHEYPVGTMDFPNSGSEHLATTFSAAPEAQDTKENEFNQFDLPPFSGAYSMTYNQSLSVSWMNNLEPSTFTSQEPNTFEPGFTFGSDNVNTDLSSSNILTDWNCTTLNYQPTLPSMNEQLDMFVDDRDYQAPSQPSGPFNFEFGHQATTPFSPADIPVSTVNFAIPGAMDQYPQLHTWTSNLENNFLSSATEGLTVTTGLTPGSTISPAAQVEGAEAMANACR